VHAAARGQRPRPRDRRNFLPAGLPRTFEGLGDTPRDGWQIVAGEHADRDLALFDALLEHLTEAGCIDPARVYTTGFSNGGFFSNLLACRRAARIAAAAPVGGGGPEPDGCGGPVPVMVTHGRRDDVVAFDLGEASFRHWSHENGCTPAELPAVGCVDAPGCTTPARMCIFDGPHTWPAGTAESVASFLRARVR
jgi:polyhydroxybutyrate depolymerase